MELSGVYFLVSISVLAVLVKEFAAVSESKVGLAMVYTLQLTGAMKPGGARCDHFTSRVCCIVPANSPRSLFLLSLQPCFSDASSWPWICKR